MGNKEKKLKGSVETYLSAEKTCSRKGIQKSSVC